MKKFPSKNLVFLLSILLFLHFYIIAPKNANSRYCSGDSCNSDDDCGHFIYQTANYCCYGGNSVCNNLVNSTGYCVDAGEEGNICCYNETRVTHVDRCRCGCQDGSCRPQSQCSPQPPPPGSPTPEPPVPPPPPPPPPPTYSCSISVNPVEIIGVGSQEQSDVAVNSIEPPGADIYVEFFITPSPHPTVVANIIDPPTPTPPPSGLPPRDNEEVFQVTFQSIAVGQNTYSAKATMEDGSTCETQALLEVINPLPWWQVRGGDVVAGGGNLVSQIPAECSLDPAGSCSSYLILDNPNGSPGVPSAGGQIFLNSREPSLQGWKIFEDQYRGSQINYSFFENKIPTDAPITGIIRDTIDANYFTNGGITYKGYYLYQFQGNDSVGKTLEITGSFANLGSRRVILFVKNADLVINTRINVQRGVGGFYAFVEGNPESSNGITIGSDVGDVLPRDPEDFDLEGLFYTDKNFTTESRGQNSDYQLRIRGIVSARNFNLQRHLPNNAFYPAEFFEFAPDILLNFPPLLTSENITWREVNP